MPKELQREGDIKAWTLQQLRRQGRIDGRTLVANEYALPTEELRTDLAVLGDEFVGIEIKSPRDTLRRLPNQMGAYRRIFDRTILVCSSQHIAKVVGRFSDVELWEVTSSFELVIHNRPSPANKQTPCRIALGRASARRAVSVLPSVQIDEREALLESFRAKFSISSDRFWNEVGGGEVTRSNLNQLSRFLEQRAIREEALRKREKFWISWQDQARARFA